jgi:retinol dehydrogenase 12
VERAIDDTHAEERDSERIALITGASSGIGLAAARARLERGWTVVCASRESGSGAEAVERLRRQTGSERVAFIAADLSRPRAAAALSEAVASRFGRLDALANNAGALFQRRITTADGFEQTFALNHLAPFVLTNALLPALARSRGRVVTVSSNAALGARLQLDDPNSERRYSAFGAYAWSKLCNQLFAAELARRLDGTGVRSYAVHPGFVASGFGHGGGWMSTMTRLSQRLFGRSPERGADGLVWLMSAASGIGASGGYYVDRSERVMARKARDPGAGRRLWERSEAMVAATGVDLSALGADEVLRS